MKERPLVRAVLSHAVGVSFQLNTPRFHTAAGGMEVFIIFQLNLQKPRFSLTELDPAFIMAKKSLKPSARTGTRW